MVVVRGNAATVQPTGRRDNPIGRAIIGEGFGVAIANGSETVEFDAIRNVISGVERSDAESGRGPSVCRIHIRIILGPLRVGQESAVKERRKPAIEPRSEEQTYEIKSLMRIS